LENYLDGKLVRIEKLPALKKKIIEKLLTLKNYLHFKTIYIGNHLR
jgi:hypothetical protein